MFLNNLDAIENMKTQIQQWDQPSNIVFNTIYIIFKNQLYNRKYWYAHKKDRNGSINTYINISISMINYDYY